MTGLDLPGAIEAADSYPGVEYVAADVTDGPGIARAVADASVHRPLRAVVNCAGIAPSVRILGRSGVHDLATYANVVNVNLVGTFNVLARGAEAIVESDPDAHGQRGVIVNTASIAAFEGQVGQAAYASSKSGVVGLTLAAARDLAQYGIRVCTIAPGIVETPMMASFSDETREGLAASVPFPQRLARPEEFAHLVHMIIDHDSLNGEVLRMDGALRMGPR